MKRRNGFTLAELLIALAILGVIATFAIPKILSAQQDTKYKSMGKEVASVVSGSLQMARLQGADASALTAADLTPYMNYVSVQTSGSIDSMYNSTGQYTCDASMNCLKLHNGGVLAYNAWLPFCDNTDASAIWFRFDPDGKHDSLATGPAKTIVFWLYANGRIRTWGTIENGTKQPNCDPLAPDDSVDPPWFSWN